MSRDFPLALACWFVIVLLLAVVPWVVPGSAELPNTASMQGYNLHVAYLLVVVWFVLTVLVARTIGADGNLTKYHQSPPAPKARHRVIELLAVGMLVMVFYWPAALSRFGPHVEDSYFLMSLWRMACGDKPFTDFEFLYGPAMIHLPGWWISLTGYSMKGYYSILMFMQVSFFVCLMWVLQRYIERPLKRYLVFLVLLPFFLDLVFGLNWIPWRYFAATIVILMLAHKPHSIATGLLAGVIIGCSAVYSYEYAIAAVISGVALLVLFAINERSVSGLVSAGILILVAGGVWFVVTVAITGADFQYYLSATRHIIGTATTQGLGQFAFGWTLHSLGLFFILAGVLVVTGVGCRKLYKERLRAGDLQIAGAVVFALVVLKIAFQRVDHLHLIVPFVPLIVVLLIDQPRRCFASSRLLEKGLLFAIVLVSISHAVGQVPTGRWVVFGIARGWLHEVTGRDVVGEFEARRPGTVSERSEAAVKTLQLAASLNGSTMRDKPVLFYGGLWAEAFKTGVCPVGYSFYDILYSDGRKPLKTTLENYPDLIVVMKNSDYGHLMKGTEPALVSGTQSVMRRVGRVISSVHFTETRLENTIEFEMWRASLGNVLRQTFEVQEQLADVVLLRAKR